MRATLIAIAVMAVMMALRAPTLAAYEVTGEDFGFLLNSTRQFDADPGEWVTEGYSDYFVGYPEVDVPSGMLRPATNLSAYVQSAVVSPTSVAMLLGNYLIHGLAVGLTYLFARRVAALGRVPSLVASGLMATSFAVQFALQWVAYRADMLGAVFGLAAVMVLESHIGYRRRRWLPPAAVALLLLAVFAKETAFSAPLVAAVFIAGYPALTRGDASITAFVKRATARLRADWALIAAVLSPMVVFLAVRYLAVDVGTAYVVQDLPRTIGGVPVAALNPFRFAANAFLVVPTDDLRLLAAGPGGSGLWEWATTVRTVVAVALSGVGWLATAVALRRSSHRARVLLLLTLGLVAGAVPFVLKADARFMYFAQLILLPMLVLVAVEARRAIGRPVAAVLVALFVLAGPVHFIADNVEEQADIVRSQERSAELRRTVSDVLAGGRVDRLYLLNDIDPGSLQAKLEMYAALADHDDVSVRVIDHIVGYDPEGGETSGVTFTTGADTGEVRVDIQLGDGERFFSLMDAERAAGFGVPGVIEYGPIDQFELNATGRSVVAQNRLTVSLPARDSIAVVGFDPVIDGVHVFIPDLHVWGPWR